MFKDLVEQIDDTRLMAMLRECYTWRHVSPCVLQKQSEMVRFCNEHKIDEKFLRELESDVVTVACTRYKGVIKMLLISRPYEFITINN